MIRIAMLFTRLTSRNIRKFLEIRRETRNNNRVETLALEWKNHEIVCIAVLR